MNTKAQRCELCHRERKCTFHHLIPKFTHKKKWCKKQFTDTERQKGAWVCRDCHDAIHKFIDHKDLAREWNSIAKLKQHPQLKPFVAWVQKQTGHRIKTKRMRR